MQSLALNRTPRATWGSSWSWSASMTPGSCPGSDLGTPLSGPAAPGAAACAPAAARWGVLCASCASAGRTAAGAGAHHSGRMRAAGVTPAKSGSAGQSRQGSSQGIVIRSIGSSRGGLWRPLHGRGWTFAPIPLCPSCAQPRNENPACDQRPRLGAQPIDSATTATRGGTVGACATPGPAAIQAPAGCGPPEPSRECVSRLPAPQ